MTTLVPAKRNFNRFDGRENDAGFAAGAERRLEGQARFAERARNAEIARGQRSPVKLVRSIKQVSGGGEFEPVLPADFINAAMARLQIHVGRGHWDQAKETIDALAAEWQLLQVERSPEAVAIAEKRHWHVTAVFPYRIANLIEQHCNGTIGALLEIFPMGFVGAPSCGPETIKKITDTLLRIGALTVEQCQERLAQYDAAISVRQKALNHRYRG